MQDHGGFVEPLHIGIEPATPGISVRFLLDDAGLFMFPFGRDERPDRFSDDLFRLVTKETFGGGVPARDDPVQVLADNGVIGRFDDRRQAPACFFAARPIGDVAQVGDEDRLSDLRLLLRA